METYDLVTLISVIWTALGFIFFCSLDENKIFASKTHKILLSLFIGGPLVWVIFLYFLVTGYLES